MLCLPASLAVATGTPAGTLIGNQATVTYSRAGTDLSTVSNLVTLPVNEVLDFTLAWQDAAEVSVHAGQTGAALTFRLQNSGNGWEVFQLMVISALSGDDFDPAAPLIHLDTNGNGVYDPALDDRYSEGDNDPELAADQPLTVFLVSDIPSDLITGDRGHLKLAVGSEEGYGVPGTVVHGQGDGGTDAIIGPGGGFAEATGTLLLAAVQVNVVKSARAVSGTGQVLAVGTVDTTSVVTYSIDVSVTGSGTARAIVISDPIPPGTAYRPGSLFLNDNPLTDAADGDAGDVSGLQEGTVTIALGDMTTDTPTQRISFQVALE
jgi:uncharacterized repeat protein (TIGR01451 family)